MERDSFLVWRRGLALLEEKEGLIMTPYERNIEVWRQLWRVVERSDLVVQIVDGRNPLLFRSVDLEKYVKEISPAKKNLLLINKADLLTPKQRAAWAEYFDEQGIRFTFFSAAMARKKIDEELEAEKIEAELAALELEAKRRAGELGNTLDVGDEDLAATQEGDGDSADSADGDEEQDLDDHVARLAAEEERATSTRRMRRAQILAVDDDDADSHDDDDLEEDQDGLPDNIRILGATELLDLLAKECPTTTRTDDPNAKINIGFVGYPNVGKSSTLNALVGAKRVAVGSTPGKTKHFQTIHLSDSMILCDCPGLVFPSFATTKAEMVCNGVLPIDQLREYVGPASLVCQRIPKYYLEAVYGITIKTRNIEGDLVDRTPTSEELLSAYAIARGFAKSSQGNPDEARAARYVLKDYVNGKLLFIHPPPGLDPNDFNLEIYTDERLLRRQIKKLRLADLQSKAAAALVETPARAARGTRNTGVIEMTPDAQGSASSAAASTAGAAGAAAAARSGSAAKAIDSSFFQAPAVRAHTVGKFAAQDFSRVTLYPHQQGGAQSANASAGPAAGAGSLPSKKSHKKSKRTKARTQWTKDDL
nr:hypothetical protein HK105_006910 [Polyrhizophydium stewartii]